MTRKSFVFAVSKEVGYIPVCLQESNEGILNKPEAGSGGKVLAEKRALCASCLVRLECLTDSINDLLAQDYAPDRAFYGGFRAGLTAGETVAIAHPYFKAGVKSIGIDEAERHLHPLKPS